MKADSFFIGNSKEIARACFGIGRFELLRCTSLSMLFRRNQALEQQMLFCVYYSPPTCIGGNALVYL
jgi:hypothetical protein